MDEVWERAVETALDGQTDSSSARSLTLDGAVKCIHGRLPPSGLLERFRSLEHLSIANVGVSSLEKFPHLPNLQKLTLSDNRIAGGLEFLVEAGLASLRDLDLSNNRIQFVEDLAPLAQLRLVSLDLYECPVTRVKDYRSRVFSMIRSLKYLDKMDADENERPESDEEDEEEDEEEEEDDPGSGEVDGEDRSGKPANGGVSEGVVDVDEDEESDADEEETETTRVVNGSSRLGAHHLTNGFRVAAAAAPSADGDDVEEDMEDEDEDDLGEEIDEEEGEDDDVVEVHEIDDSDEDEDGVEEDDDDDEEDEEDVDDEEDMEPGTTAQLTSAEGEIDGHEQGEEDENGEIGEEDDQAVEEDGEYEDDDEENGEIGEEDEQGVEENGEYEEDDGEGEDEEEDFGSEYLVRPVRQAEEDAGGSDLDPGNEEEGEEDEVEDEEDNLNVPPQPKRRRPDGSIEDSRPPPKHPKHH